MLKRTDLDRALPHVRRWAPWLLMIVVLGAWFGPTHLEVFGAVFKPRRLYDDTRIQLFHFYHYGDPKLFAKDLLGQYHSDGTGDLFRLLYITAAKLGDPMTLSRWLPFPLALLTFAGVAWAGFNVAGRGGAFVALGMCVTAAVLQGRLIGGLPRAFIYPFLAWCLVALTAGKVRTFAILTVLSAGFYPIGMVLGTLTLGLWLFVMPAKDRGTASHWSFKRRVLLLALTGVAAAAMIAPFALRMRQYGETIKPGMLADFPEAGRGGRPSWRDRPPFPSFFEAAETLAQVSVFADAKTTQVSRLSASVQSKPSLALWISRLLTLLLAFGFARVGFAHAGVRRLAAFGAATGVGYALANAFTPSLVVPQRYVQYTVPLLLPLATAIGLTGLFPGRLWGQKAAGRLGLWRAGFVVVLGWALVLTLGGRGPVPKAIDASAINRENRKLNEAVAALPKSVLVAGWPYLGPMDDLPLATLRTPFLTYQTHMPYHTKMTLLMRTRMRALIKAYFATDDAPLKRLRDEFGVTHLIVQWAHLRGATPTYFRPFRQDIKKARRNANGQPYVCLTLAERLAVFTDDKYALLDLSKLRE